jgi:hypothetical protein
LEGGTAFIVRRTAEVATIDFRKWEKLSSLGTEIS